MNIICFGKNGQVASAIAKVFPEAKFISSAECNFNMPSTVKTFLQENPFNFSHGDIIINAAAYTKVDLAEDEREEAMNINAISPGQIAGYCKENGLTFIHLSTDYVFDGKGNKAYEEMNANDSPIFTPCNFYGFSKLAGEKAILDSGVQGYIIRTSWVYSAQGTNFLKTIVHLLKTKDEIKVIKDQIGSPTYALDIASAIKHILIKKLPFGTYHFTNGGFISWFDFAEKIKEYMEKRQPQLKLASILPIETIEYKTKAKRPYNSRLQKEKLKDIIVSFEASLEKCLSSL